MNKMDNLSNSIARLIKTENKINVKTLKLEKAVIDWNNYLTTNEVIRFLNKDDKIESAENIIYSKEFEPRFKDFHNPLQAKFKNSWTKQELVKDLSDFYSNGNLIEPNMKDYIVIALINNNRVIVCTSDNKQELLDNLDTFKNQYDGVQDIWIEENDNKPNFNKKITESNKLLGFDKNKVYLASYVDIKGDKKDITIIPEQDMNIAQLISKLKSDHKDMLKLIGVVEDKKESNSIGELNTVLKEDNEQVKEQDGVDFKNYVINKIECIQPYIKQTKFSKENVHNEWGLYIYCYKYINSKERLFKDGYTCYIPFTNNKEELDSIIQKEIDKIENIYNKKDIKLLTENKSIIKESYEVHDVLNPKIWNNETMELLPEVKEALLKIKNEFLQYIDIPLNVLDTEIVGSNASYNYNSNSDLDLHLIVNFDTNYVDDTILQQLYNSKKNSFNQNYDLDINGVPVEIYIEDVKSMNATLAIYSLDKDKWIKEPKKVELHIPDYSKELKEYEDKINNILNSDNEEEVRNLIDEIYLQRKLGLATDGEASVGNLVFKEIRNKDLLQKLRDKYYEIRSKKLSV